MNIFHNNSYMYKIYPFKILQSPYPKMVGMGNYEDQSFKVNGNPTANATVKD